MEQYQSYLKQVLKRTGRNFVGYMKALAILSAITFVVTAIGLRILNVEHFILKALLVAIVDFIPILGSGAVLIPWMIIRLITSELPLAAGLGIIFVVNVVIRQLAEPYVIGKSLGVRPIFSVIIFLIAWIIAGPIGMVAATFLIMIFKSVLEVADVQTDARKEKIDRRRQRQQLDSRNRGHNQE